MSPRKPIPTHLTEAVLQEHPPKKPRRKRSFGSQAFRPTIRIYPDRRKEALVWAQETGAESDTGSGSELAQLHDVDGDEDGDVERSADFASASPEPESGLEPGQVVADPARSSSSSSSTSPHLYFEESRSKPVRRFSCPNMMSTDVSPTDYPFT
jgi:hypothetical protein